MAKITKLYLGVLQHNIYTEVFEWHYGSVEVKETSKRYQMTEKVDGQSWNAGYKGMLIPKNYLETMGNHIGYKGKFSLVDDEEGIKSEIQSDLIKDKERLEERYNSAISEGYSGTIWKKHLQEIEKALSVLG